MRSKLTLTWQRWRKRRFRELVAQGCADAFHVATVEADARSRIGRIIGNKLAQQAQLVSCGEGENVRIFLMGAMAPLSVNQVDRLQDVGGIEFAVA